MFFVSSVVYTWAWSWYKTTTRTCVIFVGENTKGYTHNHRYVVQTVENTNEKISDTPIGEKWSKEDLCSIAEALQKRKKRKSKHGLPNTYMYTRTFWILYSSCLYQSYASLFAWTTSWPWVPTIVWAQDFKVSHKTLIMIVHREVHSRASLRRSNSKPPKVSR